MEDGFLKGDGIFFSLAAACNAPDFQQHTVLAMPPGWLYLENNLPDRIKLMETLEIKPSDYELERGKPMPSKNHGKLQMRIGHLMLSQYAQQYDVVSEATLEMPERPRVPDLAFFPCQPATDWFEDEIKITEIPLGIVEILSPSQTELELIEKLPLYFNMGIKSAWLVIPVFKTIYVFDAPRNYHTFTLADRIVKDTVLGVELNMADIFR